MSPKNAWIFAVVGMGDGGWGAFYDVSCLYVLRTLLFGFGQDHQLIKGKLSDDGRPLADRFEKSPADSLGRPLTRPTFLGVQSLAECLFYEPVTSGHAASQSLYAAIEKVRARKRGVHLYTSNALEGLRFDKGRRCIRITSKKVNREYDCVLVTAPPWSLDVTAGFDKFQPKHLPWKVREAMNSSHFITSCKVFYPLKERYWETTKIPQRGVSA